MITTSASRGSSRETFFRLCSRAPETTIALEGGITFDATERTDVRCRSSAVLEQPVGVQERHLVAGDLAGMLAEETFEVIDVVAMQLAARGALRELLHRRLVDADVALADDRPTAGT